MHFISLETFNVLVGKGADIYWNICHQWYSRDTKGTIEFHKTWNFVRCPYAVLHLVYTIIWNMPASFFEHSDSTSEINTFQTGWWNNFGGSIKTSNLIFKCFDSFTIIIPLHILLFQMHIRRKVKLEYVPIKSIITNF